MELKGMGWCCNPRVNHSSQSWKVLIYHRRLLSLDRCIQAQTAGKIRAVVHSWLDRNVWGSLEGTEKFLLKSFKSWCLKQKIAAQSQGIPFTILNTVYIFLLSPSLAYTGLNWWLNSSEGFRPAFQRLLFVSPLLFFLSWRPICRVSKLLLKTVPSPSPYLTPLPPPGNWSQAQEL